MKNRIAEFRKAKNLTQPQVASLLKLTNYQSVQAIENGRNIPSVETAIKLARLLDTTVENLFIVDD